MSRRVLVTDHDGTQRTYETDDQDEANAVVVEMFGRCRTVQLYRLDAAQWVEVAPILPEYTIPRLSTEALAFIEGATTP